MWYFCFAVAEENLLVPDEPDMVSIVICNYKVV